MGGTLSTRTAVTVPVTTGGHNETASSPAPAPPTCDDDVRIETACRVVLDNLKTTRKTNDTNVSHGDAKKEAMLEMMDLFWNGPKAHHLLTSVDACKAVLETIRHHPEHTGIQQHGMGAMKNMSCNRRALAKLAELGVSEVIWSTLNRHLEHSGVQREGMLAMLMSSDNTQVQQQFIDLGACQLCCNTLRRHLQHADVQVSAMCAMNSHSKHPKAKQKLTELGAFKTILDSLRLHTDHGAVQKQGMRVIMVLSHNNLEVQKQLKDLGAPQTVLQVIERHVEDVDIQRMGEFILSLF